MENRKEDWMFRMILSLAATLIVCLLLAAFPLFGQDAQTQQIYMQKCSVCHGADGAGKTAKGRQSKVKDVHSPELQKMTEAQFADVIMKGKGDNMDSFEKELGRDTCLKLAAYMKDLAKK